MSDTLPTIWPADGHTLAKHAILQKYLEAWFPILTGHAAKLAGQRGLAPNREILFIDGFSGPGEYTNRKTGSPVIALRAALNHSKSFPIPVRMLFIEKRKDRFEHLKSVLAPLLSKLTASKNIRDAKPLLGDCDSVLNDLLDECEQKRISFGPALAFLDQFGYGDVSMKLISRILRFPQCEVFSYLDYKNMNRWISDPDKTSAFTRAFGGEQWRGAIQLPERDRRRFLLDNYKAALKDPKRGNATYVTSFSMFDNNGQPLYWLFFCTNNLRGLEEMKRAMWSVDKTGEFRFSDEDNPKQLPLFSKAYDPDWLAAELAKRLAGRTVTVDQVKEYVLTDTPCYLFKEALKSLETGKHKRIVVVKKPPGRKSGSYPDEQLEAIELKFEQTLFGL
jgi:three-Cys-motif partner protein